MDEWILDDLLECSVCLERLDTSSKVLPCQHTFCKKCLEKISRTHSELRCPECRILVDTKIDDLPPNVLLMRILEGLGVANKKTNQRENNTSNDTQEDVKQIINTHQQTDNQHDILHQNASNSDTSQLRHQQCPVYHNQPCAKAIYDYVSKEPDDLSFKKGELIYLRNKVDCNWFYGECNGNKGVFPSSYVQVVVPLPTYNQPRCKALYDFKMANDEEDGCLVFFKGDVISVIRRVDENWAEGKLGDKIGIFPLAFVEMNSVAKALFKSHPYENQAGPSKVVPPAPNSRDESKTVSTQEHNQVTPFVDLPVTSDSSSNTLTSPSSSCSSTTPTTSSSSHSSPSSPPPPPAPNKRHSFGTIHHSNNTKSNRHSAEILNIPEGLIPAPNSLNSDLSEQHCQLTRHGSQKLKRISNNEVPTTANHLQHSSLQLPASYVALFPYKPQKGDELELKRGAVYTVTERCQDGWFKGTAARGQKAGVFPGNYVAPAKSLPALRAQVRGLCNPVGPSVNSSPRNGTPPIEPRCPVTYTKSPTASANNTSPQGQFSDVNKHQAQQSSDSQITCVVAPTNASLPSTMTTKTCDKLQPLKKERSGVSIMRRLVNMKKSKSPPPTPYSLDNPVFEDLSVTQHVHIRSGSCPNQLLTSSSLDTSHRIFSPTSSHRSKQRERPSITRVTPSGRMSSEHSPPSGIEHRKSNSMDNQTMMPSHDINSITAGLERMGQEEVTLTRTNEHTIQPPTRVPHHDFCSAQEHASSPQINSENSGVQTIRAGGIVAVKSDTDSKLPMRRYIDQGHDFKVRSGSIPGAHKMLTPSKNQCIGHHGRERFRCIVPYPPNSEYELELRLGDVIYVHKKREDGWYRGTLQRTGRTGLFPASFVQSF